VLTVAAWGLVLAAGCGGEALKAAGEACVASSECGPGLVCDLGRAAPVCATSLTVEADAAAAPVDATDDDAAAPVDAAPDPIDASPDTAPPVDAAVDAPEIDAMM
jgi:hypothetical protein